MILTCFFKSFKVPNVRVAYPKKTSYLVNNSSDRDVLYSDSKKKGEKGNASNIYLDIFLYNVIDFEY